MVRARRRVVAAAHTPPVGMRLTEAELLPQEVPLAGDEREGVADRLLLSRRRIRDLEQLHAGMPPLLPVRPVLHTLRAVEAARRLCDVRDAVHFFGGVPRELRHRFGTGCDT